MKIKPCSLNSGNAIKDAFPWLWITVSYDRLTWEKFFDWVNFPKRYSAKRKANDAAGKEQKRLAEEESVKVQIKGARKIIDQATDSMLKKPCPLNNNEKCYNECAHFSAGVIYKQALYDCEWNSYFGITKDMPKCKLWAGAKS